MDNPETLDLEREMAQDTARMEMLLDQARATETGQERAKDSLGMLPEEREALMEMAAALGTPGPSSVTPADRARWTAASAT